MQKHATKRLFRVADINESHLKFRLTKEQRAKAGGEKISFRKSTQRYAAKGYRQLLARAEFNKINPATGKREYCRKRYTVPLRTQLICISRA